MDTSPRTIAPPGAIGSLVALSVSESPSPLITGVIETLYGLLADDVHEPHAILPADAQNVALLYIHTEKMVEEGAPLYPLLDLFACAVGAYLQLESNAVHAPPVDEVAVSWTVPLFPAVSARARKSVAVLAPILALLDRALDICNMWRTRREEFYGVAMTGRPPDWGRWVNDVECGLVYDQNSTNFLDNVVMPLWTLHIRLCSWLFWWRRIGGTDTDGEE